MAMTQFAMVEELASLIKDNLYSKHLILSTEEALINFLRDDASVEGILELNPTSPYHRLLLHRLADIYGFAHESVGEGDDRHLVLQRCPETAIPSVLVSDILWQYDDCESPTSSLQVLRREDDFVVKPMQSLSLSTRLEERETAYREARNRIFALHDSEEKDDGIVPKTRKVPVVARRMIAHALGQRIPSPDEKFSSTKFEENIAGDGNEKSASPSGKSSSRDIKLSHKPSSGSTSRNGAGSLEKGSGDTPKSSKSKSNSIRNESNGRAVGAENMQKEQIGAAKRIFAHALGLPSGVSASTAKVVNERDRALRRET
ncbi:R3H domain-containing protein 2-like [Ananas comosus]|uniref:R3H domain-containing protein 2-like n=1 Tax=Ananas comosus TaxID=4615 RepID=A0A6P5GQC4_ANACO|nr:R3H domain-containing protein 2-like [Ananas comosus]